jgi:hypothetical protein
MYDDSQEKYRENLEALEECGQEGKCVAKGQKV